MVLATEGELKKWPVGEGHVFISPLQMCFWEHSPFGLLEVLPNSRKPVTMWKNDDAALTNVTKGIRKVTQTLSRTETSAEPDSPNEQKRRAKGREGSKKEMARTPQTIDRAFLKKVVNQYFTELKDYQQVANYELGLRAAFQNMLASVAKHIGWSLAPEMTLGKIRPDGVLLDEFKLRRGYWEAKGPKTNLEQEIRKKIEQKYPLTNTIFEDSQSAILYQNKKRLPVVFKLQVATDVIDLLHQFFTYVEPDIENFEAAVDEFKERIPEHAQVLLKIITDEHKLNPKFKTAFAALAKQCRDSINPQMSDETIDEMLVQHLLTERLFRTVFNNPDFVNNNIIAVEMEKAVRALASRSFNRNEFMKSLDRFYVAIEITARDIDSWSERQEFMNTVYERFFQGFAKKQADTHGIVYTPQEIVDFMVASVDEVLKRDFGTSLATPGVKILDPATGTGNFIVNIIRRLNGRALKEKYANDLFCNEIMILPYYIASLNIEHEYYERMGTYEPFEGICFADTLELAEGQQLSLFVEENTERVKREKEAEITVVIGNPPYNVGQKNENDNNKNRKYPIIDNSVYETYVKGSKATNTRALSDAYVKFFRWATDRLQGRDGIVCFVSNNSFVDSFAFDGFRKRLGEEFTGIYHVDLAGNVRKQSLGNVFGIMVGVGITILVRNRKETFMSGYTTRDENNFSEEMPKPYPSAHIFYSKLDDNLNGKEKLRSLSAKMNISRVEWQVLHPDRNYTWLTKNLRSEFNSRSFIPIGTKEAKSARLLEVGGKEILTIFRVYSRGAETTRDSWMYDFHASTLSIKASNMMETYNSELSRWIRAGSPKDIDNFVLNDESKIKWSSRLKECFMRKIDARFDLQSIRHSLYRPFTRQFLYFDNVMTHRQGQFPVIFPNPSSEKENMVLWLKVGSEWPMFALATNVIPDLLPQGGSQCFPYYTYNEDGTNRRENITDWALAQFQTRYGQHVTKWDIFHYVYGILHHPQYRELYKENLKRDLPHIPPLLNASAFEACVSVGRQLMEMHIHYEQEKEYPVRETSTGDLPYDQALRVEKMKLSVDKKTLVYSKGLVLEDIPLECYEYRLGNRSALEWVIDQYQVSQDKRSGIVSDPNNLDDPEYILRLVKQVITVSLKTVELVKELTEAVTVEDWLVTDAGE
jgi:predicted helicase